MMGKEEQSLQPTFIVALLTIVLGGLCGCTAKMGVVAPVRGRATKANFSWGVEPHVPLFLSQWGGMIALPYEEVRTSVRHAGGLSEGTLATQSAGAQFRLLYLLPGPKIKLPPSGEEGEKSGEQKPDTVYRG